MPLLHRRSLLAGLAGSAALGATAGLWPRRATGQGLAPRRAPSLIVVLLVTEASAGRVAPVARAFAARQIPTATTGTPAALAAAAAAAGDREGGQGPGDLLVGLDVEALTADPYLRMRGFGAARAAVLPHLVAGQRLGGFCGPDPDPERILDLGGARMTGLRAAALYPAENQPAWIEHHPEGLIVSRGGHVARAGTDGLEAARAYLDTALDDPMQEHAALFLDLSGPEAALIALAEGLAAQVAQANEAGRIVALAPADMAPRLSPAFERLIGLRLDPPLGPQSPETRRVLDRLSKSLAEAGIGHSVLTEEEGADPTTPDGGLVLRLGPGAPLARGRDLVALLPDDPGRAAALAEAGIGAAMGAEPPGLIGLDGNGLRHLGPVLVARSGPALTALAQRLDLAAEPVLALDLAGLNTPADLNAALIALRGLAAAPGTRIVDLASYAQELMPPLPLLETLRQTRAAAPAIAPSRTPGTPPPPPTPMAREALMEDARRAWAFFETTRNPATGLPPGSVQFTPQGAPAATFDMLTQWDMGSVLFAHVAALRLGLLSAADFEAWRGLALAALRAATLPVERLPRAIFEVAAPARGYPGFNACDAGRLLSALHALDRLRPDGDAEVRALVASWDFAAVIREGRAQSVERGRAVTATLGHCASYTARAYGLWGFTIANPLREAFQGETETDARMALLGHLARTGPLGAEPLLLEAVEIGPDPINGFVEEVLFAAQIAEAEASGTLVAPSELAMERAPWFSYQGLRVEAEGEARWDVQVAGAAPEFSGPAFRATARAMASKAAYLWAAARPHPYSQALVAHVRTRAGLPAGFASGVYTATGAPTTDYSDVNTNGIILQAIAALLGR